MRPARPVAEITKALATQQADPPALRADIVDALQALVELELATLPIYMTACWSIVDEAADARESIHEIFKDEMWHLANLCNLVAGLGDTPILRDRAWFYHSFSLQDVRLVRRAGELVDRTVLKNPNVKLNWQATRQDMISFLYFDGAKVKDARSPGISGILFDAPTLGNSSTAIVGSLFWRSQARLALTSPEGPERLFQLYANDHVYVFPEHNDHDRVEPGKEADRRAGRKGDLFPANTPYFLVSQGSSGSDRPFLAAVFVGLAADLHATYLLPGAMLTLGFMTSLAQERRWWKALGTGAIALALRDPRQSLEFLARVDEDALLVEREDVHCEPVARETER